MLLNRVGVALPDSLERPGCKKELLKRGILGQQALRRATQESQPRTSVFRNPDSMSTERNVQLARMTNFLEDLLPCLPEVPLWLGRT